MAANMCFCCILGFNENGRFMASEWHDWIGYSNIDYFGKNGTFIFGLKTDIWKLLLLKYYFERKCEIDGWR